jgi:hypothetical protein
VAANRRRGKPRGSGLSPAQTAANADAVRIGVPFAADCERVGVPADTGRHRLRIGGGRSRRKRAPAHVAFVAAIKKAQADDIARRVGRIEQAARGGAVLSRRTTTRVGADGRPVVTVEEKLAEPQWPADAWHLERTEPQDFGRPDHKVRELLREVAELKALVRGVTAREPGTPGPGPAADGRAPAPPPPGPGGGDGGAAGAAAGGPGGDPGPGGAGLGPLAGGPAPLFA